MSGTKRVNLIFLDIDGVLNSKSSVLGERISAKDYQDVYDKDEAYLAAESDNLSQQCVGVLNYLLKQIPDCRVIVHSTWTSYYPIDLVSKHLKRAGVDTSFIVGTTPKKMSSEKVHEIGFALHEIEDGDYEGLEGCEVGEFVIIENTDIFGWGDHPRKDKLYLVDDSVGLSYKDLEPIIRRFVPDYEAPGILI